MGRRHPLNIVIDTNVIVASLIRKGIVRELLVGHPRSFMTPEACIDEVWGRRSTWNRRQLPDAKIAEALSWLTENIVAVMPQSVYRERDGEVPRVLRGPVRRGATSLRHYTAPGHVIPPQHPPEH